MENTRKNLDISIFDIVGPVMLGPSSSGTAGMMRIGSIARLFLDAEPANVEIQFHPRNEDHYAGYRSHLGLAGGIMGMSTSDPEIPNAFKVARKRGIQFSITTYPASESVDMLRVRLVTETAAGSKHRIAACSVGGGNVRVESIDEIPVSLSNYAPHLFVWADKNAAHAVEQLLASKDLQMGCCGDRYLFYTVCQNPDPILEEALRSSEGVERVKYVPAFFEGGSSGEDPLFTEFSEALELCKKEDIDMAELMLRYEERRSGRGREQIIETMKENWACMKRSVSYGISGEYLPLYGLDDGQNAKRMMQASEEGRTFGGTLFNHAVAYSIGVMEYAMSMGCITATPTCGSSGIMPACMVALQEEYGCSDEEIIKALFACTSIGIVMAYDGVRFSGAAAGCQGEMTVSSAMAAMSVAYLGGCDAKALGHAACFAVKGLLGLVCDPMGCAEVPCIKRNAAGTAAALSSGNMAIAGIESFISPDDASFALKDVQDALPEYLRGGGGGTCCTPTALNTFGYIKQADRDYMIENGLSDV